MFVYRAKDSHQIAEANQAKNDQLRQAFGISDSFVEGSSFDPDRKAKEAAARKAKEEEAKAKEMAQKKYRYVLKHTDTGPFVVYC